MQQSMLGQLNNLLQYFHQKEVRISVEVAVHGEAFNLLLQQDNPLAGKVEDLHNRSVQWLICENTLRSNDLQHTNLLPFTSTVPAAIGHLVERQLQGWAYIRC